MAISLLLLLPCAAQETAEVYMTAKDSKDRISKKESLKFAPEAQPEEWKTTIFVKPDHSFQEIQGIGGALTDAAAETFASLDEKRQEELLTAYYDPIEGIGYTLARTHINSCDFSSASYAYTEPDDRSLDTFSVKPDLRYRIPFIKRILKRAPELKIFASPWSPPAWMKTTNQMIQGGKLKSDWAPIWADYYGKFVKAYEAEGIPIWGLTVQNEPMAKQTWESCIYTAEEERDFIANHLGPALAKAGLSRLKLMCWDHNRNLLFQRASTVLDDPKASQYVWGTAFHWYDGADPDNVAKVHDAFPDKALLFSEGCNYPFGWDSFDDWKWGEQYGRAMIDDFNNWASGWTDWNILLDHRGGPNHVSNFCFAPVHADAEGNLRYMNSFYYIGHFSKFVRPGAKRIACTTTTAKVKATAFVNPDGSVVTVALNEEDKAAETWLWINGKIAPLKLPPHSIATLCISADAK